MNIESRLKKLESENTESLTVAVKLDNETESQCRERLNMDRKEVVFISQSDYEL